METFMRRTIAEEGFQICAEGGLQGLLWWYDCKDDGKTYEGLKQDIAKAAAGSCAWLTASQHCPDMTGCGAFPDVHRRRRCGAGQPSLMSQFKPRVASLPNDKGNGTTSLLDHQADNMERACCSARNSVEGFPFVTMGGSGGSSRAAPAS